MASPIWRAVRALPSSLRAKTAPSRAVKVDVRPVAARRLSRWGRHRCVCSTVDSGLAGSRSAALCDVVQVRRGSTSSAAAGLIKATSLADYEALGRAVAKMFNQLEAGDGLDIAVELPGRSEPWHVVLPVDESDIVYAVVDTFLAGSLSSRDHFVRGFAFAAASQATSYRLVSLAAVSHHRGVYFSAELRLAVRQVMQSIRKELVAVGDIASVAAESLQSQHASATEAFDAITQPMRTFYGAGLLSLERVQWETHSAEVLDFIAKTETVHPTDKLTNFKLKFGKGRRVLGLFHHAHPGEPLAYVHIGLTPQLSTSLDDIQTATRLEGAAARATHAMFYSIGTTHQGLNGLNISQNLIAGAVGYLRHHMPHISRFSTLSPIPLFMHWFVANAEEVSLTDDQMVQLAVLAAAQGVDLLADDRVSAVKFVHDVATDVMDPWFRSEAKLAVITDILQSACERYLELGHCPVRHFHLGNGAVVHSINSLANLSAKGVAESGGMMVNYLYEPHMLGERKRQYVTASRRG